MGGSRIIYYNRLRCKVCQFFLPCLKHFLFCFQLHLSLLEWEIFAVSRMVSLPQVLYTDQSGLLSNACPSDACSLQHIRGILSRRLTKLLFLFQQSLIPLLLYSKSHYNSPWHHYYCNIRVAFPFHIRFSSFLLLSVACRKYFLPRVLLAVATGPPYQLLYICHVLLQMSSVVSRPKPVGHPYKKYKKPKL